jgi:hypothetical protein
MDGRSDLELRNDGGSYWCCEYDLGRLLAGKAGQVATKDLLLGWWILSPWLLVVRLMVGLSALRRRLDG